MYNGSKNGSANGSSSTISNVSHNGFTAESPMLHNHSNGSDEFTFVASSTTDSSVVIGHVKDEQSDAQVFDELREILVAPEITEIDALREDVDTLQRWTDDDYLFERMKPVVNQVIERQIREAPQDVIEILYPLLGGMVKRSVQEAMKNLADQIDAQRKRAFNFQRFFSKFRAESNGVSSGAVELRDALPFAVEELFVIHNESGLLIHHESTTPNGGSDSDIIGAMLTAIGDFVQDAFGETTEGHLEGIAYGDKRILLEKFNHVYVAAVVDGIEPFDYRHEIRRRISAFEQDNRDELVNYGGDPSILEIDVDSLRKLLFNE